jgi:hypothetical protein
METVAPQLEVRFHVTDPDVVGPLAVFPLIAGAEPTVRYLPFAAAKRRGAAVKELAEGASVNDLLVENPLDLPVLLYEGEEVVGAQQNRTFDVSVLVPERSTLKVPVSCVEAGRWDGRRHGEAFGVSAQAAYPAMRMAKSAHVRASVAAGFEPRADQQEVWREVAEKADRYAAESPTNAMSDVYERHRGRLNMMALEVGLHPDQVGALAAIGGRFVVLDHVSDPEAWDALHVPLVKGYALDALEAPEAAPPSLEDAQDVVAQLLGAPVTPAKAVGLGEHERFDFGGLAGMGLKHDGELVALSAYA